MGRAFRCRDGGHRPFKLHTHTGSSSYQPVEVPDQHQRIYQVGSTTPGSRSVDREEDSPVNRSAGRLLPLRKLGHTFTPEELQAVLPKCTDADLRALALLWFTEGSPAAVAPWAYQIFRELIAEAAGVTTKDVSMVGSLRAGFSLSPEKFGEPPHAKSDLDALVVSEALFSASAQKMFSGGIGPNVDLDRVRMQANFLGFVDTKYFSPSKRTDTISRMHECFVRLKDMTGLTFDPNKSDIRIYRSWQCASRQIALSLSGLQQSLAERTKANFP